jgi:hypothetical protein
MKKRYVSFSSSSISIDSPFDLTVGQLLASGDIKPGKSSDDVEDLSYNGKVLFDTVTGKFQFSKHWYRAKLKCPDCHRHLQLRVNFLTKNQLKRKNSYVFVCDGFETRDCSTFFWTTKWAKITEFPLVSVDVRNARKLTTKAFSRLYNESPEVINWSGGIDQKDEMNSILNTAKSRAYRFLARELNQVGLPSSIAKIDSIEDLRKAYLIITHASVDDI